MSQITTARRRKAIYINTIYISLLFLFAFLLFYSIFWALPCSLSMQFNINGITFKLHLFMLLIACHLPEGNQFSFISLSLSLALFSCLPLAVGNKWRSASACIGQAILARSWRLRVFVLLPAFPSCHGKPQCNENCENGKWHERVYYCNRRWKCNTTYKDNNNDDDDDGNDRYQGNSYDVYGTVHVTGWLEWPGEWYNG